MTRETQCLVIGSGIAGLSTALAAADKGIRVTIVSSADLANVTNTWYAQGGIIYEGPSGKAQSLVDDILEAGCHINYSPAVKQLADQGPKLVKSVLIDRLKTPFDRGTDGKLHLTREGAHSEDRIVHIGDETGKGIEGKLLEACQSHPHIEFVLNTTAVNLLMTSYHDKDRSGRHHPSKCFGAFVFDQKTQEVYPILAGHTMLATGGVGQLYLHSTNSKYARGDGIALAHRAGCRLENLEYVQFHPTTFYKPNCPRFLISEALRGEGAFLINAAGERFLSKYLTGYATPELAPRDRVAWGIHQELLSTGTACVYLDITHKPADWIKDRFPFVYRTCLQYEIDITEQPIPVVPGAHYMCGGVWVDLQGRTSISNLWAGGETACTGLHGANRLASTSLLEGLVWGTRSGEAIATQVSWEGNLQFPQIEPWISEKSVVDPAFLSQDWLTLKHTMWNYAGLMKTSSRLARAEGILTELARGIDVFYRRAALSDSLIGLRHASLTALLILEASRRNKQSLGCYLREYMEI